MCIGLGYPSEDLERKLLRGDDRRGMLDGLQPLVDAAELDQLRNAAKGLHLAEPLLDYVQALVRFTRQATQFELGLSPRGAQDLVTAARCSALINGHAGVRPEDVKTVFGAVAGHRLRPRHGSAAAQDPARFVLESVPIP